MNNEKLAKIVFLAAALVSVSAVLLICVFLFGAAFPTIVEIGPLKFLLGKVWRPGNNLYGIFPMIVGSLYVTGLSILFGGLIGVMTAVFLANFCPKWLYRVVKPAVELLAGIPSVVYGFFGLMVLVPLNRALFGGSGKSVLTASILLTLMVLPTIVTVSETSLRAVPEAVYLGALALGDTKEMAYMRIVLPGAKSGVASALILGIGRSIGETMAVIMVAGNQAIMPSSVLKGVRTMTANIVLEMGYATDMHREALIATGAVLFVFILLINLLFSLVKRGGVKS